MNDTDPVADYINANQLASAMNKTKWRKLATAMTSNPDFEPQVREKHLLDKVEPAGFTFLDWEWVKSGETKWIDWMELSPIRKDYVGRLIDDKQTDFTEWLRAALIGQSIPFEEIDGIFKVRGYIWPNA
ncbi:DUF6678 family protein [Hymenobacter monticola]|uniref:Uncharacterized protein n=1 Tax=Hymenobacter monticola TaxID=1705399 RepID=A0ABY4B535_9BACT|nr:DUF6678 family protein [Hymenobacter monticola]UOE31810.1 hypothetical protein MTP16_11755 [Hymenobacter monticola]